MFDLHETLLKSAPQNQQIERVLKRLIDATQFILPGIPLLAVNANVEVRQKYSIFIV